MRLESSTVEMLRPWFPDLPLDDVQIVTNGPLCWFVRTVLRQGAMTISPFIIYGKDAFDPTRLSSMALLAHELKHVEQYRRYGHVIFLARYLWALGRNGFRYSRDLPLEFEAYALQDEVRTKLRSQFAQS